MFIHQVTIIIFSLSITATSYTQSPPYILDQPESFVEVAAGERLQLKVRVQANPEPSYRWWRNGVELPYAIGSDLVVPHATTRDEGQYVCSIKNEWGSVLTQTIMVRLVSRNKSTASFEQSHGKRFTACCSHYLSINIRSTYIVI